MGLSQIANLSFALLSPSLFPFLFFFFSFNLSSLILSQKGLLEGYIMGPIFIFLTSTFWSRYLFVSLPYPLSICLFILYRWNKYNFYEKIVNPYGLGFTFKIIICHSFDWKRIQYKQTRHLRKGSFLLWQNSDLEKHANLQTLFVYNFSKISLFCPQFPL